MDELTVRYQGETITATSASGEARLQTAGHFCEGDITLYYARPVPDLRELEIYVADFLSSPPTVTDGALNTGHRTLIS